MENSHFFDLRNIFRVLSFYMLLQIIFIFEYLMWALLTFEFLFLEMDVQLVLVPVPNLAEATSASELADERFFVGVGADMIEEFV